MKDSRVTEHTTDELYLSRIMPLVCIVGLFFMRGADMKMKWLVMGVVIGEMLVGPVSAENAYHKAEQLAQAGQIDFAFMQYRKILHQYQSDETERLKALFALGEYYYLRADHQTAFKYFQEFIDQSQDTDAQLFALMYLYKMAIFAKDDELKNDIIKDIIEVKRNSYIFDDEKEYDFLSPLDRHHKAVYTANEIKFYVKDQFVAEISFL